VDHARAQRRLKETRMLTRRSFVQVALTSAGGLLVGCRTSADRSAVGEDPRGAADGTAAGGQFGAYIEITPDNRVWVVCPQSEMGQGIHDGLPKLVAEELEADWSLVEVRMPWADDAFINPLTKRHRTAASESTMIYFDLLRTAGAAAREMLIAAAAASWDVAPSECRAELSFVKHAASGRSAGFGELAAAAALLPVPSAPRLKPNSEFRLIGTSTLRKDTPAKCDGSAIFGIDVVQPDLLFASLRRSPAVTSRLVSWNRDAALRLPGVVDAFPIDSGIAVVARSTWLARRAAESLEVEFDDSDARSADSGQMRATMLAALDNDDAALPGRPVFGGGPFDRDATFKALAAAPIRHEWIYEVPFLAHAALEPLCATAVFRDDGVEMWAPSQQPDRARDVMAAVSGRPREQCRFNVTFLGGGFGRKWENDFVRETLQIAARLPGKPVKLTWTREQDFQHDRFRPAHLVRTRVGLARDGSILAMHSRTTGISMWKYQQRRAIPGSADLFSTGTLINDRYAIANAYVDCVDVEFPVPVGTWRSVSQSMNGFFFESAIDDIASITAQDPLALRLKLLQKDPRAQGVLRQAAEKAGWGKRMPEGRGLGIALGMGYEAYCAEVAEVTVSGTALNIDRIVCAFDCGLMVDPHNVDAQVEGGIVWGLSAARDGQIRFDAGVARETNFHTAPILRISEMPAIEVHLMKTEHRAGGCGEASVPPVAPAIASAIQMATGKRPRRLPLIESGWTFG